MSSTAPAGKCLLISWPGYPASAKQFLADNGLASLAAAVKQRNPKHQVQILDYGTPQTVRNLVAPFYHQWLARIWKQVGLGTKPFLATKVFAGLSLKFIDWRLAVRQRAVVKAEAQRVAQQVKAEGIDLVGFKLWNGDGFTNSVLFAEELRRLVPEVSIVAGGPQVGLAREFVFKMTNAFDALVVGEGEEALCELLERAPSLAGYRREGRPVEQVLAGINNLLFLDSQGKVTVAPFKRIDTLDRLPVPIYDLEIYLAMGKDAEGKDQKMKVLVVDESRGCDNFCRFCDHAALSGGMIITKSAERVVEEMRLAGERYGAFAFKLSGSSTPAQTLRAIAEKLQAEKLAVQWVSFGRFKDACVADFPSLKSAGLFSLFYGLESGDQAQLDAMHKGYQVGQALAVMKAAKEAGIFVVASIMTPYPTKDTEKEQASWQKTVEVLREAQPDSVPLLFPGIFPQTAWARNPESYGFTIVYPKLWQRALARLGLLKPAAYDDERVMRYLLGYKMKNLFPPTMWAPLPWLNGGRTHRQFARLTEERGKQISEKLKILTLVADDDALIAHMAGMTPRQFRDQYLALSFTGDWQGMQDLIDRVNRTGGKSHG